MTQALHIRVLAVTRPYPLSRIVLLTFWHRITEVVLENGC